MDNKKPRAIDRVHEALYQHAKEGKTPVSIIVTHSFDLRLRYEHGSRDAYFLFAKNSQKLLGLPYVVIHDLPEDFKIGT